MAQFMGAKKILHDRWGTVYKYDKNPSIGSSVGWVGIDISVKYHTSYDWLIPVWVKFRELRFDDVEHQFKHSELKSLIGWMLVNGTIETTFTELGKAIEWYNSLKK